MADPYNTLPPGMNAPISIKPFSSVDLNDDIAIRSWLSNTGEQLAQYYAPYRRLHRDNIYTYLGGSPNDRNMWSWNGGAWDTIRESRRKTRLNIIQPVVESHLSRLVSTRANVSALPTHSNEYKDLAGAKTVEKVIEMSFRDRKINCKLEASARNMLVCGASYMWVQWDECIGPRFDEVTQEMRGEGVPLLDENGEVQLAEDGSPVMMYTPARLGDVNYKVLRPDQVMEQPSQCGATLQEKDWVIIVEMIDTYKLKEKHPELADKIQPGEWSPGVEAMSLMWGIEGAENQTMVLTLLHRSTKSMPNGYIVRSTKDIVLEAKELPFEQLNRAGMLPIARLDDTIPPGYELPLPLTVMEAGKAHQELFNGLNNNIIRNLSLSAPKWVVSHQSGVRKTHLSNDSNIVYYNGNMQPNVVTPAMNHVEAYQFRDKILEEMRMNTGSSHTFNAPPPNTRAAEMLQHQEEQEYRRAEPLIRHMNDFQAEIAHIAVCIMASMYEEDDSRALKLFGPGGGNVMIKLRVTDLSGAYDIKFERTSALPESKQGRLNEAARLFEMGVIDKDQYRKVIGYSSDPDLETAEAKAYEYQLFRNDLIRHGHDVSPPLEHEDHVESLKALYPLMVSVEFAEMPPEIKAKFVQEILAREMLAWKRAQTSPAIRTRLSTLTHYPSIFTAMPGLMPVIDPLIAMQSASMKDAPGPAVPNQPPPPKGSPGAPEAS